MSYLAILIPVSLAMGLVGLGAFYWALTHQQFDDPKGNAWRVLNNEDRPAAAPRGEETSSRETDERKRS